MSVQPKKNNNNGQKTKNKPNRRRGGYNKKEIVKKRTQTNEQTLRDVAIKNGSKISPAKSLVCASGSLKTIKVNITLDNQSLLTLPCGMVSMGKVRVSNLDMYGAYSVVFDDVKSLASGNNGVASSRWNYLNSILGSIVPKSIPFREDCSLQYEVAPISAVIDSSIIVYAGKNYYMYVDDGGTYNGWATQNVPPVPTPESASAAYKALLSSCADRAKHLTVLRDVPLRPDYLKDASAFARNSPFYGRGGGVGSPYGTTELEGPFKSKFLCTLVKFSDDDPRASRSLDRTSGDSCCNYGLGLLPWFKTSYYKSAVTPIFKFLDLGEFAMYVIQIYLAAVKTLQSNSSVTSDNTIVYQQFNFSYAEFLLMLRQQLLTMFADSQCLGQFITMDTGNSAFMPFLCGSNCYPAVPEVKMKIPSTLNENLKMLKLSHHHYETLNYNKEKNVVVYVPVWGAFLGNGEYNPTIPSTEGVPLFVPGGAAPDLWDGTFDGNVCNINAGDNLSSIVTEWNQRIEAMENLFSGVDTLGGDCNGSPLLQYTRYVQFVSPPDVAEETKKPYVIEALGKHVKIERTKSNKNIVTGDTPGYRKVYAIPGSNPVVEYTTAMSGYLPITATHKQYFTDLFLPIIDVTPGDGIPGQSQVQTATMEPYSIKTDFDPTKPNLFNNRANQIQMAMHHYVCGVAGKKSPLTLYIESLAESNQGAFLGDLFAFVGDASTSLGFGGIGTAAKFASGVANTFGV